jgi:glycosyltransferase involved in cell wall biosynthesis
MRILFVIHYCSPETNDNAHGPIYLGSVGHEVLVISARHAKSLKGDVYAEEYEKIGDTTFYRPYKEWLDITRNPFCEWKSVQTALDKFRPEVVIGFGEFNYKLSLHISKHYQIPYLLYMEYLRLEKIAPPIRGRTFLRANFPAVSDFIARQFLKYLAQRVAGVMFAYFGDRDQVPGLRKLGVDAFYVPWCTDVGVRASRSFENNRHGIYIGALEKFKSSDVLIEAIPIILDRTETERFTVVGPGPYSNQIRELQKKYGDRLAYIESVPREIALDLIQSAAYGFTPVTDCGLGFIGDCWGCGTPLVVTNDLDGFLHDDRDVSIADSIEDLPQVINPLLQDAAVWEKYHREGQQRYSMSLTAEAVGKKYLEVIERCLPGISD